VEYNFEKAIELTKLAWKYSDPNNQSFSRRISLLEEKLSMPHGTRNIKMSQSRIQTENEIRESALRFISELKIST
jgi:hypothetical protein